MTSLRIQLLILLLFLLELAGGASVAATVPGLNSIYANSGIKSIDMTPYTSTTTLAPLNFTITFTRNATTTNYRFGYAIQEINYVITNQKINYSLIAGSKTATSQQMSLYTNNANKITVLSLYYIVLEPLFGVYTFSYVWLSPMISLINGQSYSYAETVQGPLNLTGSLTVWNTFLGIDANLSGNKQIDLYVAVTAPSTTSINYKVSTISVASFYLTSVIVGAFLFNYNELNTLARPARITVGSISSVNGANTLSYSDSGNIVRSYNTIMGMFSHHITNQANWQEKCTITPSTSITASSSYAFSYFALNYIIFQFPSCPTTTPLLYVPTLTCYDVCPIRYVANYTYNQCDACPTYDCYTCYFNGSCATCSSAADFRSLNAATMRCVPLSGYYDNGVSVAVACVAANCLTCTSATFCLSCASGKYLSASNTCLACIANCLSCTTATDCQTCSTFRYYSSGTCVLNCSSISNCSTCSYSTSLSCTTCNTGYLLTANTCVQSCGNGVKTVSESCDDGNTANGDGCSSACAIQTGFYCTLNVNNRSTCLACLSHCSTCTNGVSCSQCNTGYNYSATNSTCYVNCSSLSNCLACTYTTSVVCTSCATGYPLTGGICVARCGDGIVVGTQVCDDGNTANGDGCSSTCTLQSGFYCTLNATNGSVCHACISSCSICSNGVSCTQCNNGFSYSATNSTCYVNCSTLAHCLSCTYTTSVLCTNCATGYPLASGACAARCGDGIVAGTEVCDDGNTANGDGCSSTCTLQSGFYCTLNATNGSVCHACISHCSVCSNGASCTTCNNGFSYSASNSSCYVDCSTIAHCLSCTYTTSVVCTTCSTGYPLTGGVCAARCGDGYIVDAQTCDDGNTNSGDGCSSTCIRQSYFYCNNVSVAGGVKSQCGACISHCQVCTSSTGCSTCDSGYYYTSGNNSCNFITCDGFPHCQICSLTACTGCLSGYALTTTCNPICGDGNILADEGCDDGNAVSGDGCSSSCSVQTNFTCSTSRDGLSVCSLTAFWLEPASIIKDSTSNSFTILFEVLPPRVPAYSAIDWMSSLPQNSNLTLTLNSFSYDQSTNYLSVSATYKQPLNAKTLVLAQSFVPNVPFDKLGEGNSKATLITSDNLSLEVYTDDVYGWVKIVQISSIVVGSLALVFLVMGFFASRLIALETIAVIQLAFFGLLTLDDLGPVVAGLRKLSYSSGYSFSLISAANSERRWNAVGLGLPFLNNYVILAGPFVFFLLLSAILSLINCICYRSNSESLSKWASTVRGQLCFYSLMFSSYTLCLSNWLSITNTAKLHDTILLSAIAGFVILAGWLVYTGLMMCIPNSFGQFRFGFKQKSYMQNRFYLLMVVFRLGESIALGARWFQPQVSIVLGFLALRLTLIVFMQPYEGFKGNFRQGLNTIISLTIITLELLLPYMSSIPSYAIYCPLAILGLLALAIILGFYYFIRERQQILKDSQVTPLLSFNDESISTLKSKRVDSAKRSDASTDAKFSQIEDSLNEPQKVLTRIEQMSSNMLLDNPSIHAFRTKQDQRLLKTRRDKEPSLMDELKLMKQQLDELRRDKRRGREERAGARAWQVQELQ